MEQLQNIYTILTTILFLYLGIIWSKSNWKNVNFKFTFIILSIAGFIISLSNFGYIMKG